MIEFFGLHFFSFSAFSTSAGMALTTLSTMVIVANLAVRDKGFRSTAIIFFTALDECFGSVSIFEWNEHNVRDPVCLVGQLVFSRFEFQVTSLKRLRLLLSTVIGSGFFKKLLDGEFST